MEPPLSWFSASSASRSSSAARSPKPSRALAADLSTTGNGGTGRIDITITRWSTPEEREQLRTVLVENGTEAVYTALQKMKSVGRIRVNDSLGWDLRYSGEVKGNDGRRIVFATDRPISTAEAVRQPIRLLDVRVRT